MLGQQFKRWQCLWTF